MKHILVLFIILYSLFSIPSAWAHGSGPTLPDPGFLPGSFGHKLERFFEDLADKMIQNPETRLERALERASERVSELDTLVEVSGEPDLESIEAATREYKASVKNVIGSARNLGNLADFEEVLSVYDLMVFEHRSFVLEMLAYAGSTVHPVLVSAVKDLIPIFREATDLLPGDYKETGFVAQRSSEDDLKRVLDRIEAVKNK